MKNQIFLSLVFLFSSLHFTAAQQSTFKEMKFPYIEASASIGLLPTFVKDLTKSEVPPIAATVSYRICRKVSVGVFAGYTRVMSHPDMLRDGEPLTFNTRFSMVGGRIAAHCTKYNRWDIYGGFGLNYTHANIEVMDGDILKLKKHKRLKTSSGKMMWTGFVGTKFAVNPSTSLFGEVGFGISLINVGFSKRFKVK